MGNKWEKSHYKWWSVFDKDFIFSVLLPLIGFVVIYLLIAWVNMNSKQTKKNDELFLNFVLKGTKKDVSLSLEDILNTSNLFADSENFEDQYSRLERRLDWALYYVVSQVASKNYFQGQMDKIKEWRLELAQKYPYTNTPPAERRILKDVREQVQHAKLQIADSRLDDLANLIQIRNEQLEKAEKMNNWSLPTSIAGTFFTLFFGISSLRYSLKKKTQEKHIAELENKNLR